MRQRLAAALVTIPIAGAGLLTAHSLAYRLTTATAADEHRLLDSTGHGYLAAGTSLMTAVGVAALAAGLLLTIRTGARTARRARLLAAVPPVAFAVQEHTERLVHDGVLPAGLLHDPTFLAGLLLQLPFALLGYVVVRLLLRTAIRLGAALRYGVRLIPPLPPTPLPARAADRRTPDPLADRAAGRAPPGPLRAQLALRRS